MAPPEQRSLRQECGVLHQRVSTLGAATRIHINQFKQQIQTLEQQTQTLAQHNHVLEQQNHALEQRIHALEASNKASEAVKSHAVEMDSTGSIWLAESTAEDLPAEENPEDLSSKHVSRDDIPSPVQQQDSSVPAINSVEHLFSPVRQQDSPPPTTNDTQSIDYSVWYENGTLTSDAPDHFLTTQDWQNLLTTFASTRTFFDQKDAHWHLTTNTNVCVRELAQKTKKKTEWTVDAPGEFCCKRCFNTQRVCLKYNEQSQRLEALPLPEEARPEGAVLGVEWFVAAQPNLSNKAGFKGLW
ncbi:unnamed protein product [Aureobasidium uvarum]|uniref:Uncharacterized protein n=1 Tax=Aureobasidium uvarum TaxID=2773716 RepID=A0A9N8KB98_9PEZI|nr:unnamed protein product [Aureobasidium uvarum]